VGATDNLTVPVYYGWVERSTVCGSWRGIHCAFTFPDALQDRTHYTVFISSWSPGGMSTGGSLGIGWQQIEFNTGGPLPSLPSGIQASVSNGQPTIHWNDDPNATRWYIWVGDLNNLPGA